MDKIVALQIDKRTWEAVNPDKRPEPDTYPDFLDYISEKIEMSLDASDVKNRGGYILEAIREKLSQRARSKKNASSATLQRNAKEQALEDLTRDFRAKCDTLIRQAVHADPQLVDLAAKRIQSYIVRQRLEEHPTPMQAYQKGGMVKAEINAILAAEFCSDLLAPVNEMYEHEKARILGNVS